jgi:hypothetical protein
MSLNEDLQALFYQLRPKFDNLCKRFQTLEKHKTLIDKLQNDVAFLISRTAAEEQLNYVVWFCVNTLHAIDDVHTLLNMDGPADSYAFSAFLKEFQSLRIKLGVKSNQFQDLERKNILSSYILKMKKFETQIETIITFMSDYVRQLKESLMYNEHVTVISLENPNEEVTIRVNGQNCRTVSRKLLCCDAFMSKEITNAQLLGNQMSHNELVPGNSMTLLLLQIDEKEQYLQECYNLALLKHNAAIQALQSDRNKILRNRIKSSSQQSTLNYCGNKAYTIGNSHNSISVLRLVDEFEDFCDAPILTELDDDTFEGEQGDELLPCGDRRCGVNNHGYNDWTAVDVWHQKERATKELYDTFVAKYRRVRQLRIDVDYPEELPEDDSVAYLADMEWWNDHIRYMKSQPGYEPYIAASRDTEVVACHPQLGPWTGPYKELTDSSMIGQYSKLYEKDFEELEMKRKQKERDEAAKRRKKKFGSLDSETNR